MLFQPRYLKEAKNYLHAARRLLRYRKDLLTPEQRESVEAEITKLDQARKTRDEAGVEAGKKALEGIVDRVVPQRRFPGLRENIEVFLVAIVIAAGIRAYFLQPFRIPTGSMQPTLNGIVGQANTSPAPNWLTRGVDFLIKGKSYIKAVAETDDVIVGLKEGQHLNYFTYTDVIGTQNTYRVAAPAAVLQRDFGIYPGMPIRKGEPFVQGTVVSGDFVFVDKLSYNFRTPKRGEVFVFKTTGIRGIEDHIDPQLGSQYYIKRLAGLPGDTLRIAAPKLFINGEIAQGKAFEKVMSEENGYRGYANPDFGALYLTSPSDTFTNPPKTYFALGDNSYNSSDSRYWGIVPQNNITGRGFLVFWPLSNHWGRIQ